MKFNFTTKKLELFKQLKKSKIVFCKATDNTVWAFLLMNLGETIVHFLFQRHSKVLQWVLLKLVESRFSLPLLRCTGQTVTNTPFVEGRPHCCATRFQKQRMIFRCSFSFICALGLMSSLLELSFTVISTDTFTVAIPKSIT